MTFCKNSFPCIFCGIILYYMLFIICISIFRRLPQRQNGDQL
ncbi:MAG: hypothetical protein IJ657_06170 [Acidaminococcaceae bacterium]|nr:hypothetical protein [Acidaminococcaceae bacterium]MBR1590640.1 hypothetical protein [Acidaminococcaceae bacterium]